MSLSLRPYESTFASIFIPPRLIINKIPTEPEACQSL